MRVFIFLGVGGAISIVLALVFGEVVLSILTGFAAYGKLWASLALKKLGWASLWNFVSPLVVRMATWEIPKRIATWALFTFLGAHNRRFILYHTEKTKRRIINYFKGYYVYLDGRFGWYAKVIVGGILVVLSILLSIFVLSFYIIWFSASFFRALMMLGRFLLNYAWSTIKIMGFNMLAFSPLKYLPRIMPKRYAIAFRRFNIRVARTLIGHGRTKVPRLHPEKLPRAVRRIIE